LCARIRALDKRDPLSLTGITHMEQLRYLNGYSPAVLEKVKDLLEQEKLGDHLLRQYPKVHDIRSAKALYQYTMDLKNTYMSKARPLSKVVYDDRIDVIKNALGLHSYIMRVQGSKLKAKNEIQIASVFKKAPEPFLRMIVVHELAHFKEKEHNKAFYQLCQHMEPDYYQLEFDLRLYLTHLDLNGPLYS